MKHYEYSKYILHGKVYSNDRIKKVSFNYRVGRVFYIINLSSLDIKSLLMLTIKKNYIKANYNEISNYHFLNLTDNNIIYYIQAYNIYLFFLTSLTNFSFITFITTWGSKSFINIILKPFLM